MVWFVLSVRRWFVRQKKAVCVEYWTAEAPRVGELGNVTDEIVIHVSHSAICPTYGYDRA